MSDRAVGQPTEDSAFVRFLKRKWLAILLVLLLVVIAVQNGVANDQATIFVFWGQVQLPTWLLIVVVFLIGAITGWVLARNRAARKERRARR
ncbi:LapA family protein [Leifsonia sp. RAF41]|uniref:LapA family protein n=1 Tax=Leifsonia sp. RAF41 TaxID=3233056 RepID=UPI003F9BE495